MLLILQLRERSLIWHLQKEALGVLWDAKGQCLENLYVIYPGTQILKAALWFAHEDIETLLLILLHT